jgi:predicted TPR repeat methyltransferase
VAGATFFSSGDIQADRRFEYAMAFLESGQVPEALELLETIAEIAPFWPAPPFEIGKIRMKAGDRTMAEQAFRKALELDPADRQGAGVKLRLMGAEHSSGPLPPGYVRSLFDEYAPRFDRHLTQELEYTTPQTLHKLLKARGPLERYARILDLGCGTGLAVEGFAPYAIWIEGVDLSPGMLAEAARKGFYHRLYTADLLAHLKSADDTFDLIIATDVLNYCGALDEILPAMAARLAPGGLIAFCVQRLEGRADFSLGEDHRFAHNPDYIARLLQQAGCRTLLKQDHVIRKEAGRDLDGLLYLCEADR